MKINGSEVITGN